MVEAIQEMVKGVIQEVIDTMPADQRFEVDNQTILLGPNSRIDSMTLVSVIVDLEQLLSEKYNKDIYLTDDRAMTRAKSPFETVRSLTEYIRELI